MSVRTDPRGDVADRLHNTLHISADQLAQQGIKLNESQAPSGAGMGGGVLANPMPDTGAPVAMPKPTAMPKFIPASSKAADDKKDPGGWSSAHLPPTR